MNKVVLSWAEVLAMGSESTVINDLVVLGRSSPDTMKDGRVSICAAGYSRKHGFIRLYPTRLDSPLKMWSIIQVPVERNEQDMRAESWKIKGSKSEWPRLSEKIKVLGQLKREDRLSFLRPLVSGCVLDVNSQKRSLGIVKPVFKRCYLEDRRDYDPGLQMTLFGKVLVSDKHKYGLQPRVEYRCAECRAAKTHDQQILEWGVYEWFRKYPGEEEKVWENLFSKEDRQEILFLIGNLARHQSSFMVVSVLRIPIFGHSKVLHLET